MTRLHACTIIAKNYLPFARVLARSFRKHHPDSQFSVFVVDEWRGYIDPAAEPFELLHPDDLSLGEFAAMAQRYSVVELSTAVKPWVMRHLLDRTRDGATLYLDPDIKVYGSLTELDELATRHGIALIPHLTQAIPRDGRRPSEIDILKAGAYNLGFIGLGHHFSADKVLEWWAERLETECRVDPARGFFVDQRWIDLVPGMMDVAIVRDPGYDVAYWNLHYREVTPSDDDYLVNGNPLRFFHFSGYDPLAPGRLSTHQNRVQLRRRPTIRALCDAYGRELLDAGYEEARAWPYEPPGRTHQPRERMRKASGPPKTAMADIATQRSPTAGRRSLGQRIVELEGLIEGGRRSGSGTLGVARDVITAVNPLRHLIPRVAHARLSKPPIVLASTRWGVNVVGYLNAELGVGEVGRQTIAALEASDIPVAALSQSAPANRNGQVHRGGSAIDARYPVNLVCVNADMLPIIRNTIGEAFFSDRFTIGFWNWEVLSFPQEFMPAFDLVNEVWVCSQHTADALHGRSSTTVTQVRIPIVPDVPTNVRTEHIPILEGFTFLFMFDHLSVFDRKNPLGLIDSFAEAFAPASGASLILKCINGDKRPADHELLIADAQRHRNVHVLEGYLDAGQKNALLANCDCYISLHRAEGFGLTLAEAMYFGRPVIATGYSGNLDFMDSTNSHLVDYELSPIGPGAEPYPADGEWAEPDLDHASRIMREVFEDQAKSRALGARAAADIRRTHSREAAGDTMRRRLEEIREELTGNGSVTPRDHRSTIA